MTSLGDQDLLARYPSSPGQRKSLLPISPANRHPDLHKLLFLQGGQILRKKSYVTTNTQHTIPLAALRAYDSRESTHSTYILQGASYQDLINHAGYSAPVPSPVLTSMSGYRPGPEVPAVRVEVRTSLPNYGGTAAAAAATAVGAHTHSQVGVDVQPGLRWQQIQHASLQWSQPSYVATRTRVEPPLPPLLPRWNNTQTTTRTPLVLPNGDSWYADQEDWRRRGTRAQNNQTSTHGGEYFCDMVSLILVLACFVGVLWLGWVFLPVLWEKMVVGGSWAWDHLAQAGNGIWQFLLGIWQWVLEHVKQITASIPDWKGESVGELR